MSKFKSIYRAESHRAKWWNYNWKGTYFITICCFKHECFFGEIQKKKMNLNAIGKIVEQEWEKTILMRSEIELNCIAYCIMPNHIHLLIRINKPFYRYQDFPKFGPQKRNLASLLRGFKAGVTRRARQVNNNFQWQNNYHDAIIKSPEMFYKVIAYIQNNPRTWKSDRFHKTI